MADDFCDKIRQALNLASEERYQFLKTCEAEAERWKSEGDMIGWNFHMGMAAGANWSDIFYHRITKVIDEIAKQTTDKSRKGTSNDS